jgi:hypothetical protein
MKRITLLLGLTLFALTGCQTPNQYNGAVGGGIIGGIIGTGVGIVAHNPAAGLAIGAGTGALAGTAVGAMKDRKDAKAAQEYAAAHPPMSLTDIVSLANQGIPDGQIIQQMAATNSWYNLTSNDLVYLNQNHVSPAVISAVQQRSGARPVVMGPPPPPGLVYAEPYPPPPPSVGVGVIYRGR